MERRSRLSRRAFVVGVASLGLVAGCGRLPGQTQRPAKIARIGFLSPTSPQPSHEAFRQGLRELGYLEGQDIAIEYRYAEGIDERFPALARELARLPVDVIVAQTTPATQAVRDATTTIPIIMLVTGDPVANGLVASFGRPGGNVTGLTNDIADQLQGKRLELLVAAVPGISRIATITVAGSQVAPVVVEVAQGAARALGVELRWLEAEGPEELPRAFETAVKADAQALIMLPIPLGRSSPAELVALAARSRLPMMYISRAYVDAGGLMSYAPNPDALQRRAAYYVDRVLKGARPADLPVEQPREFDFVVNLKTAQTLGITFPNEIMLQVTEVLQ